jgi:2-iminobutanoate/2-iminopropanoate deaminase
MRTSGLPALLLVVLLVGCADFESPPDRRVIAAEAAPEAIGPYSQAIQGGTTVYCSGQIGIDPKTDSLVAGGVEAETGQALDNLQAVLAGSRLFAG